MQGVFKIKEFAEKLPEFKDKLREALVKEYGQSTVDINQYKQIPNTWLVHCHADLTDDYYLVWVTKEGKPRWYDVPQNNSWA